MSACLNVGFDHFYRVLSLRKMILQTFTIYILKTKATNTMTLVTTSLLEMKPGSFTLEWGMKSCFLSETTWSTGTLIPTKPCANSYPKEL